jgi:hypothetical protein
MLSGDITVLLPSHMVSVYGHRFASSPGGLV